ncbi:MAG: 2-oxo-tetronate isomerase [Caldimonas sp.]
MPRFAANLSMLFTEVPFLDRFERAAKAGFDAVEFLFPYAFPAAEIKARLQGNGLQLALFNTPGGDWDAGERGFGCLPDRVADFRKGVAQALEYATTLGAPQVHCMAGKAPPGAGEASLRETYVGNLRFAAAEFQRAGLKAVIEPINAYDIPGYYLSRTAQALSVMDEVGAPNLFLQYDIYHAQRSEGELAATIEKHLPRIAHMQLADNPGRNEPGTGEINYPFLFAHVDRLGYTGFIGCEYKPAGRTESGLAWFESIRASMPSTPRK